MMNAETFLAQFYRYANEGYVGITYLAPDGVDIYPRAITNFAPMPLRDELDLSHIHEMNAKGYSVYFRVMVQSTRHDPVQHENGRVTYPRGAANESVFTRVLWSEIDFKDATPEDALTAVKSLKYPPSIVVRSGGGFHLYWLLNEIVCTNGATYTGDRGRWLYVEPDELKRTLKGIAKAIGCADSKVSELARIMRLPDTVNTKPERNGARCEIVSKVVSATYDYRELEMEYAPLIKQDIHIERDMPLPTNSGELPAFIKDYLASGAPNGERNDTFNDMCWAYNRMGKSRYEAETDLAPRARADGLSDHEINATLDSAFRVVAPPYVKRDLRVAARDRGMVSE